MTFAPTTLNSQPQSPNPEKRGSKVSTLSRYIITEIVRDYFDQIDKLDSDSALKNTYRSESIAESTKELYSKIEAFAGVNLSAGKGRIYTRKGYWKDSPAGNSGFKFCIFLNKEFLIPNGIIIPPSSDYPATLCPYQTSCINVNTWKKYQVGNRTCYYAELERESSISTYGSVIFDNITLAIPEVMNGISDDYIAKFTASACKGKAARPCACAFTDFYVKLPEEDRVLFHKEIATAFIAARCQTTLRITTLSRTGKDFESTIDAHFNPEKGHLYKTSLKDPDNFKDRDSYFLARALFINLCKAATALGEPQKLSKGALYYILAMAESSESTPEAAKKTSVSHAALLLGEAIRHQMRCHDNHEVIHNLESLNSHSSTTALMNIICSNEFISDHEANRLL